MNCPKCGAEGTLLRSHSVGLYYDFDCGSSTVCEGEEFEQSAPCRELCDLRKWREVVLSKVVAWPTGNPEMPWRLETWTFVKEIKPHDNIFFSVLAKEAFDSAVRKEME